MKKTGFFLSLIFLVLFGCLIFSSCRKSGESAMGGEITLYVYNWGEYISDGSEGTLNVNAEFENYCRETLGKNVKVNYSTFSSNEDMYAKISSGAAVYDVIVPSDYMIQRMISEDMILPLDLEKIPNYQYILDDFKGSKVYYEPDDGKVYSVPYTYGMNGIIYNSSIVPKDCESIGSWKLMWDENFRGDILQYNNSRDAFGTALYYLGYDVNEASEEQWREALSLLMEQKSLVQGYVMDEIYNKMKSGSAAVASYYTGDYITMYEDNHDLSFFYPKEGVNIYVDAMCIPKNSTHADLAMEYINFMCSEEIAVANAEYHLYPSPNALVVNNQDYIDYMSSIHPDAMKLLYEDVKTVKTTAYLNLSAEKLALINSLWEELKVQSTIGKGVYILCGVIVASLVTVGIAHLIKKRRWAKLYD